MRAFRKAPAVLLVGILALFSTLTVEVAARPRAKPKGQAKPTPEELVERGDALAGSGDLAGAVKSYTEALEADPSRTLTKVKLAGCYQRQGKIPEARTLLEAVAARPDAPPEALSTLADLLLEAREPAAAVVLLERLVGLVPAAQMPRVKLQLAECHRRLALDGKDGAKEKAIALYEEVERVAPEAVVRRLAAEAALVVRFGPVGREILVAKEQLASGKELQAYRGLGELAKKSPQVAYVHYLRGMAALSSSVDDRRSAAECFKRAGGFPQADYQLGVLAYEDDRLDEAIARFEGTLKKDARSQEALYYLGLAQRDKGSDAKAIEAWRRAVGLGVDTPMGRWAQTKLQVATGEIRALAPGQIIDPSSEIAIGRATCEKIEKQWPVLKDARLEERLNRILDRLLEHSDRPRRDLRYRVAVINVPVANALTVPNGKIYFFAGLVDLIRTRMGDRDEYYASVLAHELAHTGLRHGTSMIKMASSQQEYHSYFQLAMLMGALSRTHEFEADQFGALYAYRAGYDASAGIVLHEKMLLQNGEIPAGLTHPLHRERIDRLRDYLLELRAKVRHFSLGLAALEKKEYDAAADHFELFLGVLPESAPARNNLAVALHQKALSRTEAAPVFRRSVDPDPSARLQAIRLKSAAPEEDRRARRIDQRLLREAAAEYALVLRKDPTYARAHVNLAAALSDLGDVRRARALLERAVKLDPRSAEAHNNLAVVSALRGDLPAAEASLREALRLDGRYVPARFNLALVFEREKKPALAAAEWDAYLAADKASGWATVARARRDAVRAGKGAP
jgi:predicted Zn-dependent protease